MVCSSALKTIGVRNRRSSGEQSRISPARVQATVGKGSRSRLRRGHLSPVAVFVLGSFIGWSRTSCRAKLPLALRACSISALLAGSRNACQMAWGRCQRVCACPAVEIAPKSLVRKRSSSLWNREWASLLVWPRSSSRRFRQGAGSAYRMNSVELVE